MFILFGRYKYETLDEVSMMEIGKVNEDLIYQLIKHISVHKPVSINLFIIYQVVIVNTELCKVG